jgi:Icc-related predicted phosphoesterase
MKVVMLGADRSVKGGVSAVVNNLYEAGLDQRIDLTYIGTMVDGSTAAKLLKGVQALLKFVTVLPKADIVISHSPPRINGMDGKGNWGVEAWSLYQQIHKPEIWINGHIHECYGEHAHNGTFFYNVAMCDRKYEQVNPAMVIELDA